MKTLSVNRFICQRTGRIFDTEAACRVSENKFPAKKIKQLFDRIMRGKYWVPKVGDLVYVPTMMSIDHGEDDVQGGRAMVTRVYKNMSGGDKDCIFIEIAQHDRGGNWTQFLFPEQKQLMHRFKDMVARPDPDYGPSDPNGGWS